MNVTTASANVLDLVAFDAHLRGIDVPRSGDLRATLIAGGRSNLTFQVADDASSWVLRRPPLHGLTPSAHDMAREYRVVAALAHTAVPVARVVAMAADATAIGTTFQMVEYVSGRVVRHTDQLEALGDQSTIEACVDALIEVLSNLHAVDPESVGLGDFGRPTGYLERQVRRWGSQWDLVKTEDDPCDADVRRLHARLDQCIPAQSRTAIVHGDYRIDNVMLDAEDATTARAVLDWEMSTLGDPLADAALMYVYRHPAFAFIHPDAAWASPLVPSAEDLAHRYSLTTGQSLAHWNFYLALAYFKLGVIAAGIHHREMLDGDHPVASTAGLAVAPLVSAGLGQLSSAR